MFAKLPDSEREAFFSVMDEYFAQRPHLDPVACARQVAELQQQLASSSSAAPAQRRGPPAPPLGRKPDTQQSAASTGPAYQHEAATSAPPAAADTDIIGYAEALFPYPKAEAEDLELAKGEQFALIERISDDWWRGRSMDGQREGIVPSTYVQVIQ